MSEPTKEALEESVTLADAFGMDCGGASLPANRQQGYGLRLKAGDGKGNDHMQAFSISLD